MYNVVIWGAGAKCKIVLEAIRKDKCNFVGIVDSDKNLRNSLYQNKVPVLDPEETVNETIDYVVISVQDSNGIARQCGELGVNGDRLIHYWNSDETYDFIDANVKKICLLEQELDKCKSRLRNLPYELGLRQGPRIRPAEELLEKIIREKVSLSRFGDGELEIMQKRERAWFQKPDDKLARRLETVFECKDRRIVIALADDFGSLDAYTEYCADAIREYLDHGRREDLMERIDMDRIYYDAYVTRPYFMYRDKRRAHRIFQLFRQIWKNRDVLIVEGKMAYNGIRNDLLKGAGRIRRIIAPSENAFDVYGDILCQVRKHAATDTLILASLGPAATVLAYDLAMEGIQTLDIGQLDNEYEWYLRGVRERIAIPGKRVAELGKYHEVQELADETYNSQIVSTIGI